MFGRSAFILLRRQLKPDRELVHLPKDVGICHVYRKVMSMEEQERIHQEWSQILDKEGEQQVLGSSPENKEVKNTFVEIYGEKEFTEVKSNQKREIRRLPGMVWSPTMMQVLDDVVPHVFHGVRPDMGRVVEHNLPGYEMHVEHPTVGSGFLYFNLLSDTVLRFDDESTERVGSVLLPAGSMMYVAGELRWGFRFGETSEDLHYFQTHSGVKRRVETDLRLSIQLWKFTPGLLDCHMLQQRLDDSLEVLEKKLESKKEKNDAEAEKLRDTKEAIEALGSLKESSFSDVYSGKSHTGSLSAPSTAAEPSAASFLSSSIRGGEEAAPGSGLLGGDWKDSRGNAKSLSAETLLKDVKGDFSVHKTQFAKIQGVLEEMKLMQSKGQPVNDMWMKQKITENNTVDAERDAREGYNPDDVEGSWDKVDAKAKFYKAKLRTMDYDGTAFLTSRMPDVSQDAPLDMKGTIAKMAPHVRDGERLLKNLPQSQ